MNMSKRRAHRCDHCDDGWVHYASVVREADPENGITKLIKPAVFITHDRSKKVAVLSANGAGICHCCAARYEKKTRIRNSKFKLTHVHHWDEVQYATYDYETGEIKITEALVDMWMYFERQPFIDDATDALHHGGLLEAPLEIDPRKESMERFEEAFKEAEGDFEDQYDFINHKEKANRARAMKTLANE